MAQQLFGVKTALVSLVDSNRQWFKSKIGLDAPETPRNISFCGHAILQEDVFVIEDTHNDQRFADNPLVTGEPKIRFYAGKPIRSRGGHALGTLCVIDSQPRSLTDVQKSMLGDLAEMVEDEINTLALALTDELTGLANRRAFLMVGSHILSICRRTARPAHIVFFDLNKFKQINDELGHAAGDEALRRFALALIKEFRDSDIVARLGGDEFVAFCSGLEDPSIPLARLRQNIDIVIGGKFQLDFSSGAVRFDAEKHQRVEDILAEADKLMLTNIPKR